MQYTKEQLEAALVNAHQAGDEAGARKIAQAIQQLPKSEPDVTGGFKPAAESKNEFGIPQDVYLDIMKKTQFKRDPAAAIGGFLGGPSGSVKGSKDLSRKMMLKERERMIKLEQLRMINPAQAELIDDMSALDNLAVGTGKGFMTIGRGLGLAEKESPEDKLAIEQLRQLSPTGGMVTAGELAGETLPFLPAGVGAGAVKTLGARALTGAAVGGAEATTIARGRGFEGKETLAAGGLGAGIALAMELGVPVVGRGIGAVYRKLTGKAPTAPLLTATGEPTRELVDALAANDITYDQAVKAAAKAAKGGEEAVDELSDLTKLAGKTAQKPKAANISTLAEQADLDPERLAAAQRMGLAEDLPLSAMSKNPQFQDFEQGLATIIGSDLGAKQAKAVDLVKNKADELIEEFGGSIDKPVMSDRIKSSVQETRDALHEQADDLYNKIGQAIDPTEVVDTTPLKQIIDDEVLKLGGDPKRLGKLEKTLYGLTDSDAPVTYHLIDRERKKIGEQLSRKATPFENASEAELSRYYGVLTDIQEQIADNPIYGVKGVWAEAKDLVSQRKALEDEMISVFGKNQNFDVIPQLGASMKSAAKSKDGIDKFNSLMQAIPEDLRGEAMATALNDVFTQGARNQSQLNMGGFVGWYDQINRSPAIKNAMFKHLDPAHQARLDDFYVVAKGFNEALGKRTPTGRIQSLLSDFDKPNGMMSKLYNLAPWTSADPATAAASALAQTMKGKAKATTIQKADKLLSNPAFRRAVVVSLNNPESQAARRTTNALTKSREYKQWLDELPPKLKAEIATVGFIPWLLGEEDE